MSNQQQSPTADTLIRVQKRTASILDQLVIDMGFNTIDQLLRQILVIQALDHLDRQRMSSSKRQSLLRRLAAFTADLPSEDTPSPHEVKVQ